MDVAKKESRMIVKINDMYQFMNYQRINNDEIINLNDQVTNKHIIHSLYNKCI